MKTRNPLAQRLIPRIFVFLLPLFFCVAVGAAIIEEKLALEKSIQEKTERLIEKIIGSKDSVVLVTVDLEQEKAATIMSAAYPGSKMSEEEFLPGITYSYYPIDNVSPASQGLSVKRITILVTLDQTVPDDLVNRIKSEVNILLSLNAMRGDVINVQKILFARPSYGFKEYMEQSSGHIYWLVTLFLITLFLFGPMRSFFKTIVKAMEIRIDAETRIKSSESLNLMGGQGGGAAGPLLPGGPADRMENKYPSMGHERESSGAVKRFGFVNEGNIKNLIYLLRKELPEKIAVVISYLPTQHASQVLASLTPTTQSQVAINVSQTKLFDANQVEVIEHDIKSKIDYLLGGEEYFLGLLDQVDRETQENILKTVERENPALAERLSRSLFFFEDVVILDKTALQRLIREAQRRNLSFAVAMKTSNEDIKMKVMDCLTEGAQAMLAEQIDLLGEVPEKKISDEQRQISTLARDLEKTGEIIIDRTKKFTPEADAVAETPNIG
ncbi:MAG: FliG C-terminal domain-containing protein [Elusimicrobiota bacterium]